MDQIVGSLTFKLPYIQEFARVEQHPADALHPMFARQNHGSRGFFFPGWTTKREPPGELNLSDRTSASFPLQTVGETVRLALDERIIHQPQGLNRGGGGVA